MTCLYNNDHLTHQCQMWDESEKDHPNSPQGADENGYCRADGDEDPSWCHTYEPSERDLDDWETCGHCEMHIDNCICD